MNRLKLTLSQRCFYLVLLLLLTLLFYMVPYSHDEWAWGTATGMSNLKDLFQGYNGRYFGDIISILITRSTLMKALFMSLTLTSLVFACDHLVSILRPEFDLNLRSLIAALLFMMPTALFAQTYGWPAAFVNFVTPIVFLVWILSIYLELPHKPMAKRKQITLGVFLTLGTQFFSENISLYMVLLALGMLGYAWITDRKAESWPWTATVFFTSFLGAVVMFMNPAYSNAAKNTDGYKHISSSLTYFLHKIPNVLIPNIFTGYGSLLIILAILICVLIWWQARKLNWLSWIAIFVLLGYPLYIAFFNARMQVGSFVVTNLLLVLFTITYYLSLIILFNRTLTGQRLRLAWIAVLSIAGLSGPLLVADPIGPRSFYGVFVCWVLLLISLLAEMLSYQPQLFSFFRGIGNVLLVSFMFFYLLTFAYSYYGQVNRSRMISSAVSTHQSELRLPELPNTRFVWKTSTNEPTWNARFKAFYHIPQKIKVIFPDSPDYSVYRNEIEK